MLSQILRPHVHSKLFSGPSRVEGTVLSFIGVKQPLHAVGAVFRVSGVTARRAMHSGFCLRNVDVKLEFSTEALLFVAL